MCGCGCELGLVLAACCAEEPRRRVEFAPRPRSLFERFMMAWLAGMSGEVPLQDLSRGSGR